MGLFSDLPAIFTGTFNEGDVVSVTPVSGSPRDVSGIAVFRRAGSLAAVDEMSFATTDPELHMGEADSGDLDEGALVSVHPAALPVEQFKITARYPDGRGMVRFTLHLV
ncbi:hypothetical protein [Mesorhizobium sp. M7A.F.Ca.ET.027.03.2.1]|uniref:head-tail joining protein n=1 Tax=Mesorhizobium sp. M7A.F.Ca.ET.027.03.2.1 TaxID=2496656 RepID=UPI000FCA23B5|nr:hypothetical protein [Mesorhizobium sp. M7A.F.Ca.ET.027.03.2.1]RVD66411.1 hypothetical protein EN750_03610 [Mesorhizobium sp. M7A.F.Ca.ET.027.03.2.1]